MRFSIQTVISVIITTNILIMCMTLIFKSNKILLRLGYKILMVGTLLITLRFLVPFEFSFTKNIYLPKTLSFVFAYIRHARFAGYSIWHLLLIIWVIGIGFRLLSYAEEHRNLETFIKSNSVDVTYVQRYRYIVDEILKANKKRKSIAVYETAGIHSPMICGVIHPKILMPRTLVLSEEELKLVLEHELSHYFHHDLIIKKIVQILCIIYWWNPICKIFQKQVDTILEIRIDNELTHAKQEYKVNYFSCLLTVAKYSVNETMCSPLVVSYCTNSQSILHQRFELGLNESHKRNYIYNTLFITMLILVYLYSYLFTLEPFYVPSEVEETTVGVMSADFYYILDEHGIYNIYYQDEFVEKTDSLKYYYGIRPYEEGAY